MTAFRALIKLGISILLFAPLCNAEPQSADADIVGSSGLRLAEDIRVPPDYEFGANLSDYENEKLVNLIELISRGDQSSQVEASYAMLQAVTEQDVPFLSRRLIKGNPLVAQIAIVEALAKVGDKRITKSLLFELKNGQPAIRPLIIKALGKIGDDWVVDKLFELISQHKTIPPLDVIVALANAFTQIGTRKSLYSLEALAALCGEKDSCRKVTNWAIENSKGKLITTQTDRKFPRGRDLDLKFKGLSYKLYIPSLGVLPNERPWLLLCIPDKTYQIDFAYLNCRKMVQSEHFAVLTPVFDSVTYYDYEVLNYRGNRADKIIVELLDFLAEETPVATREVYMLGVKEGGSFVQRFAFLHPQRIVKALISTDDYIHPTRDLYFPLGVNPSPFSPDMLFDLDRIAKLKLHFVISTDELMRLREPAIIEELKKSAIGRQLVPEITWSVQGGKDFSFVANTIDDWLSFERKPKPKGASYSGKIMELTK